MTNETSIARRGGLVLPGDFVEDSTGTVPAGLMTQIPNDHKCHHCHKYKFIFTFMTVVSFDVCDIYDNGDYPHMVRRSSRSSIG